LQLWDPMEYDEKSSENQSKMYTLVAMILFGNAMR